MVVASFICQNKWRGVAILYDKIVKTAGNPPAVFFIKITVLGAKKVKFRVLN